MSNVRVCLAYTLLLDVLTGYFYMFSVDSDVIFKFCFASFIELFKSIVFPLLILDIIAVWAFL